MNRLITLIYTFASFSSFSVTKNFEVDAGSRFYTEFGPQLGFSKYDDTWKYSIIITKIDRDGGSSIQPDGLKEYGERYTDYNINTNFLGLKVNKFLWKSLYVSSEFQYGIGKAKTKIYTIGKPSEYEIDRFIYKTAFYGVSFGNNWVWENFSIDWSWASYERYLFHTIDGFHINIKDLFHKERGMLLVSKLSFGLVL